MMHFRGFLIVAATPLLVAAAPGSMSAADFLAKVERLEKKGPLALISKDFTLLKKEGELAGNQYRAMIERQHKAGVAPHSCPPKKGGSMNSNELISHIRAIPAKQRASMPFRNAFFSLMKKKYPC